MVVVVSAMAGVTNALITKCSIVSNIDSLDSLIEYDVTIASGEIITASLLVLQMQAIGMQARSLQGWQVPIITDQSYSNAQVRDIGCEKIRRLLDQGITPVITGFQGITTDGNITTLGKGGSDTSAAVLAAALKAHRCDIYTLMLMLYMLLILK